MKEMKVLAVKRRKLSNFGTNGIDTSLMAKPKSADEAAEEAEMAEDTNTRENDDRMNETTKDMKGVLDSSIADDEDESNEGIKLPIENKNSLSQSEHGPMTSDGRYRNKQRCLTLTSRGVTARYRHLLEDLRSLIPHHKKDFKLDKGDEALGSAINGIAEMKSCNTVLFLECRKRQDAYLWLSRVRNDSNGQPGPSVKFHVTNVHTMDELRLTGNCMKGSRPILSFDESFNRLGHCKLMKELFIDIFGTPRGHPKSKPFVDRVMAFYYADKKIWVRNYQILEDQPTNALEAHQAKKLSGQTEATSLVEIGPRFVLNPIRIFRGSFRGQTLYQNPQFISPNTVRAMMKRKAGQSYENRKKAETHREERQAQVIVPEDPLADVFR